jgi:hypothetical protein
MRLAIGHCNGFEAFRPRIREATQSRASGSPLPGEGRSPNSPAIGEQQMDPAESATILALPGGGDRRAGGRRGK